MEQELRSQINTLLSGERQAKVDIQQLQHDNEQLQTKFVHFYYFCFLTNLKILN